MPEIVASLAAVLGPVALLVLPAVPYGLRCAKRDGSSR